MTRTWLVVLLSALAILLALAFVLGLHRRPRFIHNFEEDEYGGDTPFVEPQLINEGLAVYAVGGGAPILLFPYPHGHTTEPMAQGPLAEILVGLGRSVVTFDAPGAYRSTRAPVGDIDEMLRSAEEALDLLGITGPVDVVGHSMGGLLALAFAIERPERTARLVLIDTLSGFPAAARWGLPGSRFGVGDLDFWRLVFWGVRVNAGRANLALHKKLQNLMGAASYHDVTLFTPLPIEADDRDQGVPIRMIWGRNMYRRLSYADRLGSVRSSTLVLVGRHDPQTPVAASEELAQGIADATMIVFERSGHSPFLEEPERFTRALAGFLVVGR